MTGLNYGFLPDLLGYRLRRAQLAAFQDFARAVPDLTPGQLGALVLIDRNPGLNQARLGEALAVDRSAIVTLIDRLEKRGWARRAPAPGDRRAHLLALTADGQALLARATAALAEHEARFAAALSPDERATLRRLLSKLAD